MIRSLTDELDNRIAYDDTVLYIDMTFDNILKFIELSQDEEVGDIEKLEIGLEMLVENYKEIKDESIKRKVEIFNFILNEFLGERNEGKKEGGDTEDNTKVMDFTKDADLIYASFLMDYGVDLFEMRGELDWRRFVALLRNLSDETPFKTAVKYRTMKIPSADKYGKEYRDHVMRMKRIYSLEDNCNADEVLDQLATFFGRG